MRDHASLCSALVFSLVLASAGTAQGPMRLIQDINTVLPNTSPGSTPHAAVNDGAVTWFLASGTDMGFELWRTDGTTAGTTPVIDLTPGGIDTIIYQGSLGLLGGIVYFGGSHRGSANNDDHELWRSDGTAAGTRRLKDINPGPDSSTPKGFITVGTTMFFVAADGVHGRELWKTNGTEAGTVMVKDINPNAADGVANLQMAVVGSLLYFAANDGSHGEELWRSDGTSGGTIQVADLVIGSGSSSPVFLTEHLGALYFAASTPATGREMYIANPLAFLITDLNPGASNGVFGAPVSFGSFLYFPGSNGVTGTEPWRTAGTAASTTLVKDINPGSAASQPTLYTNGTRLYLGATDATNGRELWRSDGTTAGTLLVEDINPGAASSSPSQFQMAGGVVMFRADDGSHGPEPWRTDGTAVGTYLLGDLDPGSVGSSPFELVETPGGYSLFLADDGVSGNELWRSNGTVAGTVLVKDIWPARASSEPARLTDSRGLTRLYFAAADGVSGQELWASDGPSGAAFRVKDIQAGPGSSAPAMLAVINGRVLFAADDGSAGRELWSSDGSDPGTVRLMDIRPGAASSNPSATGLLSGAARDFVLHRGVVYFAADDGSRGAELWRSDGTAAGTWPVLDINAGAAASSPKTFVVMDETIYFTATTVGAGRELWRTNGTAAGTTPVRDINPGAGDSLISSVFVWGSRLVFGASDGVNGNEPWISDGTPGGTQLLRDINPTGGSSPQDYAAVGNLLLFVAVEPLAGMELWRTDGTTAGTFLFKDLASTPVGSAPYGLTPFNGKVLFSADTPAAGREPWISDGTVAGTVMLKDIHPGIASSMARGAGATGFFFALPGSARALFNASNGASGLELFVTDGTPAGTVLHHEFTPGPAGSDLQVPILCGNQIYLSADNGVIGQELWALPAMACAVPWGHGCPGTGGLIPQIAGAGTPRLGNALFAVDLTRGRPGSAAILFLGIAPQELPVGGGCSLYFDVLLPYFTMVAATGFAGSARFALPIPLDRSLRSAQLFGQVDVLDPNGAFSGVAGTGGLKLVLFDN